MDPLSPSGSLDLWERGDHLHPLDRGLLLLSAAFPEAAGESLADWPLGHRNWALLQLHRASFGPSVQGWVACPGCGDKLEFALSCVALAGDNASPPVLSTEPITVNDRAFRRPTSRDLARVAGETDERLAAIRLLNGCRVDFHEPIDWSDGDLEEIGEGLAHADPLAETRLAFQCPVCGAAWEESIDLVDFLWGEVEARATRLLWEVHVLASAYGWPEEEILSLSPNRRAYYLGLTRP